MKQTILFQLNFFIASNKNLVYVYLNKEFYRVNPMSFLMQFFDDNSKEVKDLGYSCYVVINLSSDININDNHVDINDTEYDNYNNYRNGEKHERCDGEY